MVIPSLDFLAILNLCGAAQGVFLAFALLSVKSPNKTAQRLLAALTIGISIVVSGAVLVSTNYVFAFPHLSRVHQPFVFLGGPLLFLYVRTLTSSNRAITRRDLIHFVPFAICLLYLAPFFLQGRAEKLATLYDEYNRQDFGWWYYVRSVAFLLQFAAYIIAITFMIVRYSRATRNGGDPAVLLRIRLFAIASVVLLVGATLRLLLDDSSRTNLLVPLGASLLVYAMGYLEIVRPERVMGAANLLPSRKYEKSSLTQERSQRYLQKLKTFMESEKPYTDGNLTIQKLSRDLAIPAHHLSQTINEQLGQSFSEFLNLYRVEEAKKRLIDPAFKHLSILGIAVDVGFNSKSSFNAVFKKHTNVTPSEFRNSIAEVKTSSHQ